MNENEQAATYEKTKKKRWSDKIIVNFKILLEIKQTLESDWASLYDQWSNGPFKTSVAGVAIHPSIGTETDITWPDIGTDGRAFRLLKSLVRSIEWTSREQTPYHEYINLQYNHYNNISALKKYRSARAMSIQFSISS